MSEATPTCCSKTAPASTGVACGADGHAVGEVVFTTSMSGYQESMTDPSYAGQLITFTFPQVGNYGVCGRGDGVRPGARRGGDHARRGQPRRTPRAPRRGWLDWLRDQGTPASPRSTPARWCATSATPARCAAASFPASMPEARSPGADRRPSRRWPGATWPGTVDARRADRCCQATARPTMAMMDTGVKLSIVRNLRERGATVELHPCTRHRRRPAGRRPGRDLPGQRPGRPGRARLHRPDDPRAGRQAPGVRDLPRPPAAVPGGRASRPTSCRSAITGPTIRSRTWPPGGPRSRARTTGSPSSGPTGPRRSTGTRRCAGRPTSAPRS